ncbi:MAG: ABC transporter permease [Candidatus Pacebacteria bacterium]|nr:ABC transporter permease [Candidatus Paceibacterota bacterium]
MSFSTNIKRISRAGLIGFLRNGFVSFATVLIMAIMLFVIGALMMAGAALDATLSQLQDKVDINVYFLTDAPEPEILALRDLVSELPEVATVTYVTREEALENFRERHKDDRLTLQALEELDENPLGASLSVRAKETSQYEGIAKFLDNETVLGGEIQIIEKINYFQNRAAIEKLTDIIRAAESFGLVTTIFLIFASVLIVFNTIRLAIYTTKEEIDVMQLVGASDWYVQGPFVIEGALYGFSAGLLALLSLYPIAIWLGPASQAFLGSFNVLPYYGNNIGWLFFVLVGTGILLGAFSSFIAVRRYLHL